MIAPDSSVTVLSAHMDMGQGIYTGIATLVAEELDADWAQMRVEGAAGNPKLYGNVMWGGAAQGTGGSTAHPELLGPLPAGGGRRPRDAGPGGRRDLGRAGRRGAVENGIVSHASGRQGELRRAGGDGGAAGAASGAGAEAARRVAADRQPGPAAARFAGQDQRHGRRSRSTCSCPAC